MDLNLINMLKSVAVAAKKAMTFPTEAYDVMTLELKHPQNVISVAPPAAETPPILPGETRVKSLSDAVYTAFLRAANEGANGRAGCSIVVHQGIYIDPLAAIRSLEDLEDFSLEIIGVKDVFVIESTRSIDIVSANLTLKNLLIFDQRIRVHTPTISIKAGVNGGAKVELVAVKIHSPRAIAVHLQKSSLSFVRSAIVECISAVISHESIFHSTNSVISSSTNTATLVPLIKTTFEAKDTTFASNSGICVFISQSRASVEGCEFKAPSTRDIRNAADICDDDWWDKALRLCAGSSLFIRTSKISNFRWAIMANGWDSKIIADECVVFNCAFAFDLTFNSRALVKKCQFFSEYVGFLTLIFKGELEMIDNRMIGGCVPKFLKDAESAQPQHDFANAITEFKDSILGLTPISQAQLSANTKKAHAEARAAYSRGDYGVTTDFFIRMRNGRCKICKRCEAPESPFAEKFKYCVRCKTYCYCSKECQSADWRDHKLVCGWGSNAP